MVRKTANLSLMTTWVNLLSSKNSLEASHDENVKIPELLLRQAIDVMKKFDTSDYGLEFQHDFDTVLFAFLKK
ncbi:MAG: hypothetical protein FWE05_12195 [Defluviitaleaceae bacterium]|nr:hypothetical protein [Defluviitaleaceae bacterium]